MTDQPYATLDVEAMTSVYTAPASLFHLPPYVQLEQAQIFVGSYLAAQRFDDLRANYVTGVLNVAYDVDDIPEGVDGVKVHAPDPNRPSPPRPAGFQPAVLYHQQQFAKVGLIDGTGNPSGIMGLAAAVYMAEQLFCFPSADGACPPLVHGYPRGNLLIHCWSGGSRSVTVAALYVWYKFGVQLGDRAVKDPDLPDLVSFSALYDRVKGLRGNDTTSGAGATPSMTPRPPTYGMQEAALQLVGTYRSLFPVPALR